ncbi:MAG TPA: glycosyltransferase family 2 protein, partial [Oculatellaceae cyanobacterium]
MTTPLPADKLACSADLSKVLELTIIIPCYNEEAGILNTIETVQQYLSHRFPELATEMLLINDGSTDGTLAILQKAQEQYPNIRVISFPSNKGRGEAIKQGIRSSHGRYLIMLDADLTYDVEHIGEIFQVFQQEPKTDVV